MPFPKDIRVIDCMMNIPTDEHNVAGYESMAAMQRDAPGKSTTMPAGYMFKNVPSIGSDPAKFVQNMVAEMDKYRKPGAAKPPAGVKPPKKPKSQTSGHAADELSEHFGERMHVLKNCQLADTRKVGRNYDRFLTGWGPTIFNNWPQWADPTGGHEILDVLNREPPPPGP